MDCHINICWGTERMGFFPKNVSHKRIKLHTVGWCGLCVPSSAARSLTFLKSTLWECLKPVKPILSKGGMQLYKRYTSCHSKQLKSRWWRTLSKANRKFKYSVSIRLHLSNRLLGPGRGTCSTHPPHFSIWMYSSKDSYTCSMAQEWHSQTIE